jgi:type IV pilus assembly protein PilC
VPLFEYVAKNFKGIPKIGELEAANEHDLAKLLREQGYILISTKQQSEEKGIKMGFSLPFFKGVSLTEKLMFTRNLQVMVSAGISLPHALKVLALQAKSKKFKKAILEISDEVAEGTNFSDALTKFPNFFSELFCNMVKVGEESGTLENVLGVLIRQMEKDHELKSKIKGAMMYPMVIVAAMSGIGILMLIIIVPKITQTFIELGVELPITTRIVIGFADFLINFWYLLPAIILMIFVFFQSAARTRFGKKIINSFSLRIPVVSSLVRKTNAAYTVRTLGSLISAGVPIVRSLELVAGSLNNIYYKDAILDIAEQVKKGAKLFESFKKYDKIYSPLVIQMLEVGEETGKTSDMLQKLAEFFEEEVSNTSKNLSTIIEPVMMIIIGAVVGFFVISMIQPMYGMISAF